MAREEEVFESEGLDDLVGKHENCLSNKTSCLEGANVTAVDTVQEEEELNVTKVSVLSAITILTVIGNGLVIMAILLRRSKMTRMYYFILHLSLADLLTAFFTLLPEIIWTATHPHFYGGDLVCRAVKFAQMIGPYLSSYVLIMTAIDRYQAIIFRGSSSPPTCNAYFPPDWGVRAYVTVFSVTNFFIPLVFLTFCYGAICAAIWDNFNSKTGGNSNNTGQDGGSAAAKFKRKVNRIKSGMSKRDKGPEHVRLRWTSSMKRGRGEGEDGGAADIEENGTGVVKVEVEMRGQQNASSSRRPPPQVINPSSPSSSSSSEGGGGKRLTAPTSAATTSVARAAAAGPNINPRTHSVRGISRAKIKTIKLTVVVIVGYIVCSAPFICVQLWATWGTPSDAVMNSMAWLFWLLTLNSVVNPWIYMFFNVNMVETLWHFCCSDCCCCCCCPTSITSDGRNQGHRGALGGGGGGGSGGGQRSGGGCPSKAGAQRLAARITGRSGGDSNNTTVGFHNSATNSFRMDNTIYRSRSNTGGSRTSFTLLGTATTTLGPTTTTTVNVDEEGFLCTSTNNGSNSSNGKNCIIDHGL